MTDYIKPSTDYIDLDNLGFDIRVCNEQHKYSNRRNFQL